MKIFISGNPGVGKTTLVKRIVQEFPEKFVGFWTEEIRYEGKRWGFEIVTTWGKRKLLAMKGTRVGYRFGEYAVFPENLDEIINELEKIDYKNKILVIDEIGKMEFFSKKFKEFVNKILNNEDINLLAVVHRSFLHMVNEYIWLTRENWWDVYKKIKDIITKLW